MCVVVIVIVIVVIVVVIVVSDCLFVLVFVVLFLLCVCVVVSCCLFVFLFVRSFVSLIVSSYCFVVVSMCGLWQLGAVGFDCRCLLVQYIDCVITMLDRIDTVIKIDCADDFVIDCIHCWLVIIVVCWSIF